MRLSKIPPLTKIKFEWHVEPCLVVFWSEYDGQGLVCFNPAYCGWDAPAEYIGWHPDNIRKMKEFMSKTGKTKGFWWVRNEECTVVYDTLEGAIDAYLRYGSPVPENFAALLSALK